MNDREEVLIWLTGLVLGAGVAWAAFALIERMA